MEAISCSLVCVNNSHPPIPLPHHESVIIGRSPKTLIRDTRCSKKQVELIADLENLIVVVKQIGSNASSIERNEIGKNQSGHLTEKDSLYVLKDQYPHNVVFKFKEGGKSAVETNSTNLNAGRSKGRGKISDFFTGKSNAPSGKLKRKLCDSDSEGNGGEKRLKTDEGSDSDDEAHRAFVAVQMIIMKEMAKSDPPDKKERTEQTSFSQKMGEPCKTSHWESHDNKLLMYMSKGVKASSKGKTKVVNIRQANLNKIGYQNLAHWLQDDQHVYIGRNLKRHTYARQKINGELFANPYSLFKHTREEALQKYEVHARKELMDYLYILEGKTLGCWCAPLGCHGDVLLKLLEEKRRCII